MKRIRKIVSHNQGTFMAILVIIPIMIWVFGCQSQVSSMIEPSRLVNRDELQLEIDSILIKLETELDMTMRSGEIKMADLDRQDAIKVKLMNFAAITVEGQTVNPAGVVGLLFSILGVGAVVDNRIKDKVIKNRPRRKEA